RLHNFVTVIVFGLGGGLGKLADSRRQQIGERISGGHRRGGIEGDGALIIARTWFVLLREDGTRSEDQGMVLQSLGDRIAVAVSRVRILPRKVSRIDTKAAAVGRTAGEYQAGQNAAVPVVEESVAG